MSFNDEQKKRFLDAANPHQWYRTSNNLHSQALILWNNRGRGHTTLMKDGQPVMVWDDANKGTFLLAAFAMENMLKAFCIYEDPSLVSEGRINNRITTHNLWTLVERTSLIPHKSRDKWVFDMLSSGNESWARYPCGLNANDIEFERQFTMGLWKRYCSMILVYRTEMEKLLIKGWTGPYGFYGKWTFT